MKFLARWYDMDEVVDVALVSYFHAVRMLKNEGMEESSTALLLRRMVVNGTLTMNTDDGYKVVVQKVEG